MDIYDIFFFASTMWIGPFWIAMLVYPHHKQTEKIMNLNLSFMGPIIIWLMIVFSDPSGMIDAGNNMLEGGFKIENVMNSLVELLGTRAGASAAWAHMVAGDIFITRWMWRRCLEFESDDWVRWVSVFFGVMLMPVGVILHMLLTRSKNS